MSLLRSAALAALVLAAAPAAADARKGDRDNDRLPDRWERTHRAYSAKGDLDRDRLSNLAEYRVGFDPRDKDSDDDGVRDSGEQAGTITAFADGKLTIALASGGEVTGTVDDRTEIRCPRAAEPPPTAPTATVSSHDGGGNSGPGSDSSGSGSGDDDDRPRHDGPPPPPPGAPVPTGPGGSAPSTDAPGTYPGGDDDDDRDRHRGRCDRGDDEQRCTTADLTVGRVVREAEIDVRASGLRFDEVDLK